MDKTALQVNIPIPAIVGSLTGATIAGSQERKRVQQEAYQRENQRLLPGNYYSQVENIATGLKVEFTPFGVLYTIKNGPKDVTIEIIDTTKMDKNMYAAWQNRDAPYFKNLLLNKIHAEIQFAEQQFAKSIIDRHQAVSKQAVYDMPNLEMAEKLANLRSVYEGSESLSKTAETILYDSLDPDDVLAKESYEIRFNLDTILKEAGMNPISPILGTALSFLSLEDREGQQAVAKKILTPGYVRRHGQIAFLPDRVIFVVDDKAVSTHHVFDMVPSEFEQFEKRNQQYFKQKFNNEAKAGAYRIQAKLPDEKKNLMKEAAAIIPISDVFYENSVHPLVYLQILTQRYGDTWLEFEPLPLVKILEGDFALEESIADIPLNKIMAIQSVNASALPFQNVHTFEKMIRSFSSLPINWMTSEIEDMDEAEMAFGLDAFDIVTPNNETYDDFSPEIFHYLVSFFATKNIKVVQPVSSFTQSELFFLFYNELNKHLVDENCKLDCDGVLSNTERAVIVEKNELISKYTMTALAQIRAYKNELTGDVVQSILNAVTEKHPDLLEIVRTQVRINENIAFFMRQQIQTLEGQMYLYGLLDGRVPDEQ